MPYTISSPDVHPYIPDLFDPHFPRAKVDHHSLHGRYISNELTQERLGELIDQHRKRAEWSELGFPLMIATPTGTGKSTLVHNVIRPYAATHGQKVLYLCNRSALYKQELKSADKAVNPAFQKSFYPNDAAEYTTGSITLMTYHHYFSLLQEKEPAYFAPYSIIVADEAHFFASDALFNADTGEILASIPRVFAHCVRIYMTATPEDVLDPIYAEEWRNAPWVNDYARNAECDNFTHELYHLDRLPALHIFTMPWNFSAYQGPYVFSRADSLIREIAADAPSEKWIIFVTSKEVGKAMRCALRDRKIPAAYLDSGNRHGTLTECQLWDRIMENGLKDFRVLITTSVLDNGFSIHDKSVTRIVLFTDDRTTFLQELGRVRLDDPDQKVRVYFSRMDKTGCLHPKKRQGILDSFVLFCGSKAIPEYPYPDTEIVPNPNAVLTMKTAPNSREDLGYVSGRSVFLMDGAIAYLPYINYMARWVAKLLGRQAEEYDRLLAEDPKLAPILYKARWLTDDPEALTFSNLRYIDIDTPSDDRAAEDIVSLYTKYANVLMAEPKDGIYTEESLCFADFSNEFQALYVQLCPDDTSVNIGKNRKPWQHTAIISHMRKLADRFGKGHPEVMYTLVKDPGGFWMLAKDDGADDSARSV